MWKFGVKGVVNMDEEKNIFDWFYYKNKSIKIKL